MVVSASGFFSSVVAFWFCVCFVVSVAPSPPPHKKINKLSGITYKARVGSTWSRLCRASRCGCGNRLVSRDGGSSSVVGGRAGGKSRSVSGGWTRGQERWGGQRLGSEASLQHAAEGSQVPCFAPVWGLLSLPSPPIPLSPGRPSTPQPCVECTGPGMLHKGKIWHVYRENFQEVLI